MVTHPWPSGNTGAGRRGTPGLVSWGDITFRLGPGPRSTIPKDFYRIKNEGGFTNHLPTEPGKVSLITSWGNQQIGDDNDATVSFPKAVLLETRFDGESRQMNLNGEIVRGIKTVVNGTNKGSGHLVIGRNPIAQERFDYGDFLEVISLKSLSTIVKLKRRKEEIFKNI